MERYGKDYFEGYYRGYKFESVRFYAYRIVRALTEVLKPRRVLDIGCAKGFHVLFFRSFNVEAYGVDISSYAIERAPKAIRKYLSVVDCEQESLPFPNSYFDLVTMFEVIEHLYNYDHALKEISRVLINNGKLFVTTPFPPGKNDPTHVHVYERDTWLDILSKYGFQETSECKALASKIMRKYRFYLPFVIRTSTDVGRALIELIPLMKKKGGQVFLLAKMSL